MREKLTKWHFQPNFRTYTQKQNKKFLIILNRKNFKFPHPKFCALSTPANKLTAFKRYCQQNQTAKRRIWEWTQRDELWTAQVSLQASLLFFDAPFSFERNAKFSSFKDALKPFKLIQTKINFKINSKPKIHRIIQTNEFTFITWRIFLWNINTIIKLTMNFFLFHRW